MPDEKTPLTPEEFDRLWRSQDFKEVIQAAATGESSLRYSRILVEARVAQAQLEMVRWTKYAVFAAVGAAIVALVVAIFD